MTTIETSKPTFRNRVDSFFEISKRGSTFSREVRGGLVTVVAMAYIVILNPIILSGSKDVLGNSLGFTQVAAVTALTARVMTILFGLISKLPFAFAAGLGINSFLAASVVGDLTWPEAMGLVLINDVIIVILSATNLRVLIFDAVPIQLKIAITVGIGLFIAFIGLVDAGFVTATGFNASPVGLGIGGSVGTLPVVVFAFTLLLTGVLVARKVKGALLIGIFASTFVAMLVEAFAHLGSGAKHPGGWSLSVPTIPIQVVSLPSCAPGAGRAGRRASAFPRD